MSYTINKAHIAEKCISNIKRKLNTLDDGIGEIDAGQWSNAIIKLAVIFIIGIVIIESVCMVKMGKIRPMAVMYRNSELERMIRKSADRKQKEMHYCSIARYSKQKHANTTARLIRITMLIHSKYTT